MTSTFSLDTSPAKVLRAMRGDVVAARLAHPDVLHVEICDANAGLWRLATQDADWSPIEPVSLIGRTVVDADIDEASGELHCQFADGSALRVKPADPTADDDLPYWELIRPDGLVLEFGPGVRWQISADR